MREGGAARKWPALSGRCSCNASDPECHETQQGEVSPTNRLQLPRATGLEPLARDAGRLDALSGGAALVPEYPGGGDPVQPRPGVPSRRGVTRLFLLLLLGLHLLLLFRSQLSLFLFFSFALVIASATVAHVHFSSVRREARNAPRQASKSQHHSVSIALLRLRTFWTEAVATATLRVKNVLRRSRVFLSSNLGAELGTGRLPASQLMCKSTAASMVPTGIAVGAVGESRNSSFL